MNFYQNTQRLLITGLLTSLGLIGLSSSTRANTITWTNTSAGYWTNAANWSGASVPGELDDVLITNGSATITLDGDVVINSLTVTGTYSGSITFRTGVMANITISDNFYLGTSAKLIPTYSSTNGNGTGRTIAVLGNATINGTIDAAGQGFPSGNAVIAGKGPGGSSTGSHGGLGSWQFGPVYGSVTQPTSLGSGGYNGAGGGAIRLNVGSTMTLNGTINANSGIGNHGGAGGSVWISATTFQGTGSISANSLGTTYGGGGGRIALDYTNSAFSGSVSAAQGPGISKGIAQPGTLWEPKRFPTTGDITITNSYQYYFPDLTTNSWNLTLGPSNSIEFHGGCLVVTNLLMTGGSRLRFDRGLVGREAFTMTNLAIVGSIIVSNSTLSLSPEGTYALAGNLIVGTGSTLYAFGSTSAVNAASGGSAGNPHGIGVTLTTGGNAVIDGTINADDQGFASWQMKPVGPGGSSGSGSYGGQGTNGGAIYGSLTQPTALGSGSWDGNGGGAVKLDVAGTLTLNGLITANNITGSSGGSGGSVWLIANTFAGSGGISAASTNGVSYYGGAGGRVSIQHNTSTFTGWVSVAGCQNGQPGTLYEPGRFPATGNITITNSYQYYFPDVTTNTWNLTLSSSNAVEFHGGRLVITNLLLTGGSKLRFDRGQLGREAFDMTNLAIVGSIMVSNSSLFLSPEGTYQLAGDLVVGTSSTVYAFGSTSAVNTASGGTAGTPHGIGVTLTIGGNAIIDGSINADNQGFPSGGGARIGYGPGASSSGSYGGRGVSGGTTYGSLTQPTALGSGSWNGSSGGAVKLDVAGLLALNGAITANGSGGWGGSGGSIWLIGSTFTGTGTVSAVSSGGAAGGGGGGRIAIHYNTSSFSGTAAMNGYVAGQTGTYYLCQSIAPILPGADSKIVEGATLTNGFTVSSNNVKLARMITEWQPKGIWFTWTDSFTHLDGPVVANTATYALLGLKPGEWVKIYTNDALMLKTNVSASGSFKFTVPLDGPTKISVQNATSGSSYVIR